MNTTTYEDSVVSAWSYNCGMHWTQAALIVAAWEGCIKGPANGGNEEFNA
jgi:hypothetical protein